MQVPITGALGTLPTSIGTIYTVPTAKSGQSVYVTIESILFTNTVDDDDFNITLYQNSKNVTQRILWSLELINGAKVVADEIIKRLQYGDSILAVCNKSTVQYVVNGYYEVLNSIQ